MAKIYLRSAGWMAQDGTPAALPAADHTGKTRPLTKSAEKLRRQMLKRGWTAAQIEEAVTLGQRHPARNAATGGPATRYVHPATGRSVVIDDSTGEVIHVGGDGFQY